MNFEKLELVGDYDWGFLCIPRLPWGEARDAPQLMTKDEPIPILIAFIMGLQHALAMVGGIITVPILVAGAFEAGFTTSESSYVVSAALIVSGIASLVQVIQIPIPGTKYVIGSGLLSVMGISFTFLPIAESAIGIMRTCACDSVPCSTGAGGTCGACTGTLTGNCLTGEVAYGKLLGTILVCCWIEVALAFAPHTILKRVFPPVVTGTTVILIGVALLATGIANWGGGAYCADQVLTLEIPCSGNGTVELPFGSPQYFGLGFCVFGTLVLVEMFGSTFMRNVQVVIGLFVGMVVASILTYDSCAPNCADPVCTTDCYDVLPLGLHYNNVTHTISGKAGMSFANTTVCTQNCAPPVCGDPICTTYRYVNGAEINESKWVTFLWVHTFPIGFYAPAILPMLFGFMVTSMECIGDVTATTEASGLPPLGEGYERSIQGGVLADGLNCFFAALATTLPCTTYAQNNGVISLTRCAARRAGLFCALTLILLGVVAKFAGIILTIPNCVLGGMTSFLFVNVVVSGIHILMLGEGINRRNRFICAIALTIGMGVELVPAFVNIAGYSNYPNEGNLWPIDPTWSSGLLGLRDAIIIVLSTGFSVGGFLAVILNLIIPIDNNDFDDISVVRHAHPVDKLGEPMDNGVDE